MQLNPTDTLLAESQIYVRRVFHVEGATRAVGPLAFLGEFVARLRAKNFCFRSKQCKTKPSHPFGLGRRRRRGRGRPLSLLDRCGGNRGGYGAPTRFAAARLGSAADSRRGRNATAVAIPRDA
jgi:hypothetical protein